MSEELPEGWCISSIEDIMTKQGKFIDGDWIESKDQDPNGKIRLLQLADVGDGKFLDKSNRFINEEVFSRLKCTEVFAGDILVARMPYPLGRACILPKISYRAITVVDVCIVRPDEKFIVPKCLMYFVNSNEFRNKIESLSSGTTRKRISRSNLSSIPLPLPPLNEQKRIVAKLDSIMPRIEAVKTRLDRIPGILKRFRQSVLTAAVTGKLTEKWREEHPEVESAEVLLEKVLSLKEKEYINECKIAQNNGRRKPKKYFLNDENVEIGDIKFPTLWKVTYLGNISWVQGGIQKTPKRKPVKNFYKYLTVANVYRGYLKLDDVNSFEATNFEFEQLKLKKGDLLIVEGNGSATEIGRCALWNDEIENCIHQNHIIRSRPVSELVNNSYSLLFFNSNFGIKIMMDISSTTSGLHTLSVSKINNLPIPLPPLDEQKEIVRQVEKLFALADKVQAHFELAKARVDKLSQSVLAKAFRGELVPQDPNDEPAKKLLERILEEKAKLESAPKSPRKKATQKAAKKKGNKQK